MIRIDAVYDRYYYTYYRDKKRESRTGYTEQQAEETAMIAAKYGFEDIRYKLFFRDRMFSAKEYIELLKTYSDHIAIEESIRTPFFGEIERVIDQYGGSITIHDTIDLQLARKKESVVCKTQPY